jgi:transposase-like protein
MTQGKKAGTRYSLAFKRKALERVIAGESQAAVANDLGMKHQSLHNWVRLHKDGKLPLVGEASSTPLKRTQGKRRIPKAEAATKKSGKKSHHKPKVLDVQINRTNAVAEIRIQRLERELAFVKADRDILVKALASLTR